MHVCIHTLTHAHMQVHVQWCMHVVYSHSSKCTSFIHTSPLIGDSHANSSMNRSYGTWHSDVFLDPCIVVTHEVCHLVSAIFNPNPRKIRVHPHGRSTAALRKIRVVLHNNPQVSARNNHGIPRKKLSFPCNVPYLYSKHLCVRSQRPFLNITVHLTHKSMYKLRTYISLTTSHPAYPAPRLKDLFPVSAQVVHHTHPHTFWFDGDLIALLNHVTSATKTIGVT